MNPPDDFTLRPPETEGANDADVTPVPPPGAGISPNRSAELLADLLETTGLISAERLNEARARARGGSLAQALADEGLAPGGGVARAIAAKHHLPFIDLAAEGISREAVETIPIYVLERVVALPYRIEGNRLRIAVEWIGVAATTRKCAVN